MQTGITTSEFVWVSAPAFHHFALTSAPKAGSLLNKLREAYQHRADAEAGFDEFSALVDTASRNEWEKLSTEPRLVNGEWESVFRVRQDKGIHLYARVPFSIIRQCRTTANW